jgi:Leucine-rich repeat (LRR) protein
MPENADMARREAFLRAYQAEVLDGAALPAGLRERYRLQACLKDGERQVYLVRDRSGRPAVLKTQPAGREDTLRAEYSLLGELCHPQIPRPLAYLETGDREYLVRDYVEGSSLGELVEAQGTFSPGRTRAAAASLCRVLEYLHSQEPPVICRDLKPQNVVLDRAGVCHLIDLGAARRYCPEQAEDTVVLGTRATAPPEQFGYQQTDQRSDIYSLGMLMRFLLSGKLAPLPRGGAPGWLGRIVRRCTAFDPQARYASARAVRRALEGRWCRWAAGLAAGAACAALLLAGAWIAGGQEASALERAICRELGLEEGTSIPAERLGEVEQLLLCGHHQMSTLQEHQLHAESAHDLYAVETPHGDIGDGDLELLARCPNLRVLVLDYQQISDLSPLAELPLEYLSLTGNQISDLSPLAGMTGLQAVDLGENPVRSAEVLSGLPQLREVTLEATGITSVEAFRGSGIRTLNVRTTWVRDYTPLETCPELTRLVTGSMPAGAAETLAGLTGLEELRLYSTPGLDLALLAGFQDLRALDVYGSAISHPEALTALPGLEYVNLGGTGLGDLSFLPQMQAMTVLELRDDPLADLTPLLECPWLERVALSPRHRDLAGEQLSGAAFSLEYF